MEVGPGAARALARRGAAASGRGSAWHLGPARRGGAVTSGAGGGPGKVGGAPRISARRLGWLAMAAVVVVAGLIAVMATAERSSNSLVKFVVSEGRQSNWGSREFPRGEGMISPPQALPEVLPSCAAYSGPSLGAATRAYGIGAKV
ncbi:hypothetical protein E2562_028781 [Oryza meyeriana var. granulata]|uniref:Uncharacterized protein n=1 Tax=Oryza meyeriana var. granulata TaxID=110450 RepID=A0A6G1FCY3_9ORYZ|nr:hypothetical protein E2562_028781 [Oryza meyeriana var. granulata]